MRNRIVKDNVKTIVKLLLNRLGVQYSANIYQSMIDHPFFPSFLSFQHGLKEIGIDSIAIKTNYQQLRDELPKPVLVHITSNVDLFLLVDSADENGVNIVDEHGKTVFETIDSFSRIWDGNAMIFDRKNILVKSISFHQRITNFLNFISGPFIFLTVFGVIAVLIFIRIEQRSIFNYLHLAFSSIGLLFSTLLLLEHFDMHNSLIKQLCHSTKNKSVDCTSILNSKDAYLFGIFSWSDIGTGFFSFLFMLNLIKADSISLSVSCILSVLAFPYVFYSITYQKFVAKNWCRLCLGVQGTILALFTTSLFSLRAIHLNVLMQIRNLLPVFLLGMVVISGLLIAKPLINSFFEIKAIKPKYKQLKHIPEVIQVLFKKQQIVSSPSKHCLTVGNPNGTTCMTLVISPICNPCMNELKTLLPILKNKDDTRIEILFLTDKEKDDPFAFHLAKALISKYLNDKKTFVDVLYNYVIDYPASKFRYEKESKSDTNEKAELLFLEQINWCISNRLYSTPKLFIDGMELPNFYSVKEINYLCT